MTAPATEPVLEAAAWPGDSLAELRDIIGQVRERVPDVPGDSWRALALDRALAIIDTLEA